MSPPLQGFARPSPLPLFGLLLLGACSGGEPAGDSHVLAPSPHVSEAGWILPSAQDAEPGAGDQLLFEQSYSRALEFFQAQPPSARRILGLGQAHLGLARFSADLLPLGLRLTRDLLQLRSRSRDLSASEQELLAACQDPAVARAPSVELGGLLALDDRGLLARALGQEPLPDRPRPRGQERFVHPADLSAFAQLHFRAARLLLSSFAEQADSGPLAEPALALAAQALPALERLERSEAPRMGGADGPGRACLAESFDLVGLGRGAEAMDRLQACAGGRDAQELFQSDPSWLLLRAHLRYQEGSCNSYALAAVDLSVLEQSFPVLPAVVTAFRQLYASECSVGGRLAGG